LVQSEYSRFFVLFFFSSRRRHTRFSRDWSSDVCSSDLTLPRRLLLAACACLVLAGCGQAVPEPPSTAAGVSEALLRAMGGAEARSEERRVGKECRSRRVQ